MINEIENQNSEIEIYIKSAYAGDCIHIRFGESSNKKNIIIDSGTNGFYKKGQDNFRKLILDIENKNEVVDILILTHIHEDHIGGFKQFLLDNTSNKKIIQKIIVNNKYISDFNNTFNTSADGIITINKKLLEYNINEVINGVNRNEIVIEKARIIILTPFLEDANNIIDKLNTEKHSNCSKDDPYINKTIDDLKTISVPEDTCEFNKASISFILEYNDKSYLFLGDAHPTDVLNALKTINYVKPIYVTKLAHHSSQHNTNKELIEFINCNNFIHSGSGKMYKKTLSYLLDSIEGKINIFTNYSKSDIENLLNTDEKEKYLCSKNRLGIFEINRADLCKLMEGVDY